MKGVKKEHFNESLKSFERRDPDLLKELHEHADSGSLEGMVSEIAGYYDLPEDVPVASEAGETTIEGRRVLETIVRRKARPVLVIRNNRATIEFLRPDSASRVWADRIRNAQAVLDRVIPSVGRVEVGNNPDFTWVGTGWLAADDIIVTNRHVAREFGKRGAAGFTFRVGTNGGPMTSRMDFLEEFQRASSLEFDVLSILWIAPPGEADVAFMRLSPMSMGHRLPSRVALAEAIAEDDFVATIGYPAKDDRVPDQDLVRRFFGEDAFEKKRLAPGQITAVGPLEIEHDCSTLGGNSGSVVVNLATGEAAGLHFAGIFMEANFAVPAPKVQELLHRVQQGELPGPVTVVTPGPPAPTIPPMTPTGAPGTYTYQMQIPVEITVKVGPAVSVTNVTGTGGSGVPPVQGAGEDVMSTALRTAREAFAGRPEVIDIRLGYRFKRGWITDERVIVVELRKKLSYSELRASGGTMIPSQFLGVGVDVRTAALLDQLDHLGIDLSILEALRKPGSYREPRDLSLTRVRERMKAIFHVSPDSGFPNLKSFLGRVKQHLTATMYEWEPNHISTIIESEMQGPGRTLRMVTQRQGTEEAVNDMRNRIGGKFKHVWASVGAGKLITSAYHIKVASRDAEEFWLSSGNWKDSNQADIDPAGENSTRIAPLREHNREWHAVIANKKLATMFQKYIEFDFEEAQRVPLEEGLVAALPDLFVPDDAFMEGLERRLVVQYFDPLVLDRELDIQPLLTPDRDRRGRRFFMTKAIAMVKKATEKVYVQNQSFNLLDENNDEFEAFFLALREKQQAGLDVRVIFRDAREFSAANETSQQKLLERIKDFGLDTDFIRVQKKCHTKGIIVDSAEVLLGSHNLTNEGGLFNRDASLLVRDPEVAAYFEKIFLFDWEVLARQEADELVGGVRVALPGEETPVGFRRVSLAEMLGD